MSRVKQKNGMMPDGKEDESGAPSPTKPERTNVGEAEFQASKKAAPAP